MTAAPGSRIKAALWSFEGARVHAVIDGAVVGGLPEKLQSAECAGWDCLQRGALAPEAAQRAAYIVELQRESPFTDWLLGEVSTGFDAWGVLTTSRQPLLAMREHSRDLAEVRTPEGRRRPWRWWDAELLETLLPSLGPSQLDRVFAHGQQIVCPGKTRWTWWQRLDGVIDRQERAPDA